MVIYLCSWHGSVYEEVEEFVLYADMEQFNSLPQLQQSEVDVDEFCMCSLLFICRLGNWLKSGTCIAEALSPQRRYRCTQLYLIFIQTNNEKAPIGKASTKLDIRDVKSRSSGCKSDATGLKLGKAGSTCSSRWEISAYFALMYPRRFHPLFYMTTFELSLYSHGLAPEVYTEIAVGSAVAFPD